MVSGFDVVIFVSLDIIVIKAVFELRLPGLILLLYCCI